MKQLKITGDSLTLMCRLCLSHNMADVFLFSSELGKAIADIIMECAPIQITRHDKMPTYICRLCFTQLKTFHQFQMQAVRSDRTLQRYLQQLSDCHPQIEVKSILEKPFDNSVSQNSNSDVTTKCEPLEVIDEGDIFSSKQKVLANFSAVNKANDEISLKSEFKDEPMDYNSLIPSECADAVETLFTCDGSEINCEDSMIEIGETKVDVDTPGIYECSLKFENGMMEKLPVKLEEPFILLKEGDSSLFSENIKDVERLCSNEDTVNRTEHLINYCQNLNKMSHDVRNVLLKKITTSTGGEPYQCDICKMCFKHKATLRKHNLIHTGEKPHQCDICNMCFRRGDYLKNHKLKHTEEKSYQCNICKMCFKDKVTLKKHISIHTGDKPYQCDICQMCFRELRKLKSHNLIHTGEKPYQCGVCKMCFRDSGNLKRHHLIHTGERPYRCDICNMSFRHSTVLKRHNLIHSGEKPYQCDICKMCFRETQKLKRHKLKHTGEKPYQCDVCKICFSRVDCLKIHKLKHTE